MKRITSLLLTLLLFLCPLALAEESGFPGVWIENDGYGTLVILADGTARMDYYDGTVTECHWALTDEGARLKAKAADIPGKVGHCIPLSPEEVMTLYTLLYRLLDGIAEA